MSVEPDEALLIEPETQLVATSGVKAAVAHLTTQAA